MARKKQSFEPPKQDVFSSVIQSAGDQKPEAPAAAAPAQEYYRFSLKMPIECRDYLQEMAWRNRITITELITRIIREDMEKHPEWKETIDVLNVSK